MQRVAMTITSAAKTAWWWLRQVLGDAAYENYLRSAARPLRPDSTCAEPLGIGTRLLRPDSTCAEPLGIGTRLLGPGCSCGARLLSREEFYLDALRRRYSGVSRCC